MLSRIRAVIESKSPVFMPVVRFLGRQRMRFMSREAVFKRVYRRNIWGDGESYSGSGSTLEATRVVREYLPRVIERLGAASLLDIPCGDFNWMQAVEFGPCHYIGADIVDALVSDNQARFGNARRRFIKLDLIAEPLPTVDVVLCRDCLVHLSFSDITQAMRSIRQSGSAYLLATTYPDCEQNRDIITGSWRRLNLQAPPLELGEPIELVSEGVDAKGKYLGLWRVADIRVFS